MRGWAIILLPVALAGALGAVVLATAFSPLFPRGLARRAEIDTGMRFDTIAFIGGGLALLVVTVGLTILAAAVATGRQQLPRPCDGHDHGGHRSARRPHSARASPWSPRGTGLRIVAIGAIGGLAIAIGGAVAVALVDESTTEVLHTPSAFAADWDLQLTAQPDDPDAVIGAAAGEVRRSTPWPCSSP